MCNNKQERHCELGWAAPYCEEISGLVAGTAPLVQEQHWLPQPHARVRAGASTLPRCQRALLHGSSSVLLAAVGAVLVLSSILPGSGSDLQRHGDEALPEKVIVLSSAPKQG